MTVTAYKLRSAENELVDQYANSDPATGAGQTAAKGALDGILAKLGDDPPTETTLAGLLAELRGVDGEGNLLPAGLETYATTLDANGNATAQRLTDGTPATFADDGSVATFDGETVAYTRTQYFSTDGAARVGASAWILVEA